MKSPDFTCFYMFKRVTKESERTMTGSVGDGKKVFNRPYGGGPTAGGYVGSRRSENSQDVREYNRKGSFGVLRGNRGPQGSFGRFAPKGDCCNHGSSNGVPSYNAGYAASGIVNTLASSIFGGMYRPIEAPAISRSAVLGDGDALASAGKVTTSIAEIAAMQRATNSSDLRTAIGTAETKKTTLSGSLATLKSTAEAASEKLEGKDGVGGLNATITKKEEELTELKGTLTDLENAQNANLATLNQLKDNLTGLTREFSTTSSLLANKQSQLDNAKNKLNKLPSNAENRSTVQAEVDQLQAEVDRLKQEKQTLEQQISEGSDAEKAQKARYDRLVKQYEDAKKNYEEKKIEHDNAKKELEQLKAEQKSYQQEIKAYEDAEKQIKELETAIKSQKDRLNKLETEEAKEFEANAKKIGKLNGKDLKEGKKADKRRDDNVGDLEARNIKLEKWIKATVSAQPAETKTLADGTILKSKTINGKTYYLKNNELIEKSVYDGLSSSS